MELEAQVRTAIRDAVNRPSRKPFYWGGLVGYKQVEAIAEALHSVPDIEPETGYLQRLTTRVDRVLEKHRMAAQDLSEAHAWLKRIADCLRYPPRSFSVCNTTGEMAQSDGTPLSSQQVQCEMEELLQQFRPDLKRRPAQRALYHAWHRLWETVGMDLLHCYDIPSLPPDNLDMEGLFGRLRRHQRRISGRKSTRELRDLGQYQVLFVAQSEEELLQQLRQVPVATYQSHRRRLAEAEAPRQFLRRLHRDPVDTMRNLIDQHTARRASLGFNAANKPPPVHND